MRVALAATLALASACLESRANVCADGRVCPPSTTCDDDHGLCITDGQREACAELGDGMTCEVGSQTGRCDLGVCVLGDTDGDGIVDASDNCLTAENEAQADADGDGFGDVCDGCADLVTESNHDEDADSVGDDCDSCPNAVNLQEDADGDGVGDVCDPGPTLDATLIAFDPFTEIGDEWSAAEDWDLLGDEIAPAAPLPPGDPGLRRTPLSIDEPAWTMAIGFRSAGAWEEGDRVGLALVDDAGAPVLSCEIRCAPDCALVLTDPDQTQSQPVITPVIGELRMSWVRSGGAGLSCTFEGGNVVFGTLAPAAAGAPALVASPGLPVRYFAAWQSEVPDG